MNVKSLQQQRKGNVLLGLAVGVMTVLAVTNMVLAQDPTPTPTPTPTPIVVDDGLGLETGATYDEIVVKIDSAFESVNAWLDSSEDFLDELGDAMGNIYSLAMSETVTIDGETYTTDELAEEIGDAMDAAFIFRCYVSSPLLRWLFIFLVWIVIVMLIKFAVAAIPYIITLVDFVWSKLVDLWQSIPFI